MHNLFFCGEKKMQNYMNQKEMSHNMYSVSGNSCGGSDDDIRFQNSTKKNKLVWQICILFFHYSALIRVSISATAAVAATFVALFHAAVAPRTTKKHLVKWYSASGFLFSHLHRIASNLVNLFLVNIELSNYLLTLCNAVGGVWKAMNGRKGKNKRKKM